MRKVGLYAGSFDPPTKGHVEIIASAAKLLDHVIVGVGVNSEKKYRYPLQDRLKMLGSCVESLGNVEVREITGLTVTCAKNWGVSFLVRGMRNTKDAEREIELAIANAALDQKIQTIIIPANMKTASISSTLVREVLNHGGDATEFIPPSVVPYI